VWPCYTMFFLVIGEDDTSITLVFSKTISFFSDGISRII
jgi:hypothetical protein